MARITVEDCIDKFPSRFELVLVAANRARKLHSGETPTVDIDNDKNTVIDLIEEYQTASFSEDEEIYEDPDLNKNDEIETDDETNKVIENVNIKSEEENQSNIIEENKLDDLISDETSSELSEDSE